MTEKAGLGQRPSDGHVQRSIDLADDIGLGGMAGQRHVRSPGARGHRHGCHQEADQFPLDAGGHREGPRQAGGDALLGRLGMGYSRLGPRPLGRP